MMRLKCIVVVGCGEILKRKVRSQNQENCEAKMKRLRLEKTTEASEKKESKNRSILGENRGRDAIKVSFMSAQLELHE